MANKFSPGYTTDLRGYAIRILQGRVLYFNSDGIIKSCSIEEGLMMQLHDLCKKSITSPAILKRSFTVSGYNNKNAFKSAAAKMREGKTISDFCHEAILECERQSTKPHRDLFSANTEKLILDVHLPNVYRKKNYVRITVKFKINPNLEGGNSIHEAMRKIESFVDEAKHQLYLVDGFEDIPFADLPNPTGIRINSEDVVIEFKVED